MAMDAKVNVVPGSDGLIENEAEAMRLAIEIGYPVLIKATAGGGGKGMRVAHDEEDLKVGLKGAATEAEKAFGMHWATFTLTDEDTIEPKVRLEKEIMKYKGLDFKSVVPGSIINLE